jgi:hypothetical protein
MSLQTINDVLERAKDWSPEDQETLTEFAREIESHRTGVYTLNAEELEAINRGIVQADKGDFVSAETLSTLKTRFNAV